VKRIIAAVLISLTATGAMAAEQFISDARYELYMYLATAPGTYTKPVFVTPEEIELWNKIK
jgi:hypothetical protein